MMKTKEQTLAEFLIETRKDLDKFEKFWREGNGKEPEKFPLILWAGDWWEQFQMFQ